MIVQLEDLKQALNIDNTTSDDLLFEVLKRADQEAKTYCNRIFEVANYTEYYDGQGTNLIFLRQFPVVSITSIHDDIGREYTSGYLLDDEDYTFDEKSGAVTLDYYNFMKGKKNVKVIYRAGYGTGTGETNVPEDLKNAIIDLAISDFLTKQGSINSVSGQPMEFSSKTKGAYEILDKYRKLDF